LEIDLSLFPEGCRISFILPSFFPVVFSLFLSWVLPHRLIAESQEQDSAISAINEEESQAERKGKVRQWLNRF
jgi:hypothetical protein